MFSVKSYRAASDVEVPHIGVCQGPGARSHKSTSAAGPGRSTVPAGPMRRQEPSESGFLATTVGCCCSASGLPAGKNSSSFQCPRNTEKFQLSAPTKRSIVKTKPLRTRRSFSSLTREETYDAPLPYFQSTNNPNPNNKSCLSEAVEVVVTVVAVAASEVCCLFIIPLSTPLSPTLMSSFWDCTLKSTIGPTQSDFDDNTYFDNGQ